MRMPAEWGPHEACLMAWPTRRELWGKVYAAAKAEYAAVARAISRFEPVVMVACPGQGGEVARACGDGVDVVEIPIDDSWLRDSGPIFVGSRDGELAAVDFRFNSWGERYLPYDADSAVSERLLKHMGIERIGSQMVLEGGSISVDGEGTLITTEQCLLHPNRNPDMSRAQIENELKARLGVSTVIWLPYGHADDRDTDGHVDGVCAFIGPGRVLIQGCEDPHAPDYDRMAANRSVLEKSADASGRKLEIIEVPYMSWVDVGGEPTSVGYVNFYLANGGVVVPIAGVPADDEAALAIIQAAIPDRQVVGVVAKVIAFGGGGVHCITQQLPASGTAGKTANGDAPRAAR